jgi:hypothetical protein
MPQVSEPPEKGTRRQIGEAAVEAAVSAVPIAGGPLAVVWVQWAGAAYAKRKQEWEREIASAVQDLIDKVDDLAPERLVENVSFLDAVAFATTAAVTTGQQEKLDALRNAVLNTALPGDLDADTQAIFLRHVRDLTPSHLRLLKLLSDPPKWFAERDIPWPDNIISGGLGESVVEVGIPELAGRRDLYDQLERDISAAGLYRGGGLHVTMSAGGLATGRATEAGKAFLAFISDPRDRLPE